MNPKTDQECAQILVAAAMVAPHDKDARQTVIRQQLTDTQIQRGGLYIASGYPITPTTQVEDRPDGSSVLHITPTPTPAA